MDNTVSGSALQNDDGGSVKIKLLLAWLAVMLPMIWGVMHVLDGSLLLVP